MNPHQKHTRHFARCPAYCQAFERLEEALEKNTPVDNSEQLDLIGRHLFGDLWKPRESAGEGKLPE